MIGGGIGGVAGLVQGIKDTAAAGHTGKLRRTQYLFLYYLISFTIYAIFYISD
jgi:hypothetical protein